MVRFGCLKTHSGCSVGKGLAGEMLEQGGLFHGAPRKYRRKRGKALRWDSLSPLCPPEKAGVSISLPLCGYSLEATSSVQGLLLLLPRHRTLKPFEFYKTHLESKSTQVTPDLLKDLLRGCA